MEHIDPVLDVAIGMIKKTDDLTYALRDLVLNTVASGAISAAEALSSVEAVLSEARSVARDSAAARKDSDTSAV